MNEFAARIERDFPLRHKEKEKMEFRTWLVHTFKELGYTPKLESGESALSVGGSVTNVHVSLRRASHTHSSASKVCWPSGSPGVT